LNPRQLLNLAILAGPYGKLSSPSRWFSGLNLKKVIDSKHGLNLGYMKPRIPGVLNTKDNKIQMAPPIFINGLKSVKEKLSKAVPQRDPSSFMLIGRRHIRSNNSWLHNIAGLNKGKNRCTAMMNTADAEALGLAIGELVNVKSDTGTITLPVEITDNMMPGVVSIPHGYGHNKNGIKLSVASGTHSGGVSVNDITDQNRLDEVTGNAAFSGQVITITKANVLNQPA